MGKGGAERPQLRSTTISSMPGIETLKRWSSVTCALRETTFTCGAFEGAEEKLEISAERQHVAPDYRPR